jgi:hypothetical protein
MCVADRCGQTITGREEGGSQIPSHHHAELFARPAEPGDRVNVATEHGDAHASSAEAGSPAARMRPPVWAV